MAAAEELECLRKLNLKFPIRGENVKILSEPKEFFSEIKRLSKESKNRIAIASLYIGSSELEEELVECIRSAARNSCQTCSSGPPLKVDILLDYNRGTRGGGGGGGEEKNSKTLLLPLLKEFPNGNVKVSFFYSPNLRGWLRKVLPQRWNETINLCHLKIYIFDDTLVMSGANLSDQYFRNRQDRYFVFEDCSSLSNFFHDLLTTVGTFSFQLDSSDKISLHHSWNIHPFLGNREKFVLEAKSRLERLLLSKEAEEKEKWEEEDEDETGKNDELTEKKTSSAKEDVFDTIVYPLVQMKHLGISLDEITTSDFFEKAPPQSQIKLASGYFNLTSAYMEGILFKCSARVDVLTASPKVNGFYGAKGMAGFIPAVYTCLEKQFFEKMLTLPEKRRVQLYEYQRNLWTFHAKGIWYYPPGKNRPLLTFVGSTNFGYRSVYRDLEAQVIVLTTNPELQKKLHTEQERIFNSSVIVSEATFQRRERRIPFLVRIATIFLKTFF